MKVQVIDVQYKEDVCCVVCKSTVVIKAVKIQPCKLLACQNCCIELVSEKQFIAALDALLCMTVLLACFHQFPHSSKRLYVIC